MISFVVVGKGRFEASAPNAIQIAEKRPDETVEVRIRPPLITLDYHVSQFDLCGGQWEQRAGERFKYTYLLPSLEFAELHRFVDCFVEIKLYKKKRPSRRIYLRDVAPCQRYDN